MSVLASNKRTVFASYAQLGGKKEISQRISLSDIFAIMAEDMVSH